MKLLITLDFPPEKGGIQRYLSDIVLHTFTADDLVISGGAFFRNKERQPVYPCRIIRLGPCLPGINKKALLLPMLFVLFYYIIRRNGHVIVHAGNIYAALLPGCISHIIPVRYHVYCYGTELLPLNKKYSLRGLAWKMLLRRAEAVYYLTNTTRQLLERSHRCGKMIRMFPRIDLPDYRVCRKTGDYGTVRLLSVGRLVQHKGHAVLIEAVSMLPAEMSWRLTIVGNGPEYGRLTGLVHRYDLDKKILIAGEVCASELEEYYKSADIFIFPSIETASGIEGFGIVLLEAMAYGAAIVASRSGSIAEVVDDDRQYAELVAPGDPAALKNALMALMVDPERRFRMACAARQLLEKRYVWK